MTVLCVEREIVLISDQWPMPETQVWQVLWKRSSRDFREGGLQAQTGVFSQSTPTVLMSVADLNSPPSL